MLESEKRLLETELEDLNRALASLGRKHDSLLKDMESQIPLTEHMNIVEECRRYNHILRPFRFLYTKYFMGEINI